MSLEILSDDDIAQIFCQAESSVTEEMEKLGLDVTELDTKLHIKCEAMQGPIKEDVEKDSDDEAVDDQLISEPNVHFPGLLGVFEADIVPEEIEIDPASDDESDQEMEIDDEEIAQDASGVLEPALGELFDQEKYFKKSVLSFKNFEKLSLFSF